jgi:3-oxoacyl-[acyl-carrier protein] reductase
MWTIFGLPTIRSGCKMANMSRLSNKVAIVTGASKGIGSAIATALGAAGARVAVNYSSDREGAERVAQGITDNRGEAIAVGADVSKTADAARLFKEVDSAFGRLDILVNNAGVFRFGAFAEITEESFHLHYNINVLGAILTVQEAIKRFGADGGSIINLSSIVGSHPVAGALLYASTKGAIETLTRGLALELASRKIRVNAIAPGHTETEGNVAAGTFEGGARRRSGWEDAARPARSRHGYRPAGGVPGVRRISLDHWGGHSCRRRSRCGHLSAVFLASRIRVNAVRARPRGESNATSR